MSSRSAAPINIPAAVAVFILCLLALPSPTKAAEAQAKPAAGEQVMDLGDLERAFWACDYVATTEGVQATPIAACRFATEQLKKQKFEGNFEALVTWWQQNKATEHQRMKTQRESEALS